MKKFLIVLAASIGMLATFVPPASAAQIDGNCNTYANNTGSKKVEICVYNASDANNYIWGKTTFDNVPGFGLPYAVASINGDGTRVWSSPNQDAGPYCAGKYPACNGSGDGNYNITNMVNSATPYIDTTNHYFSKLELHCWYHTSTSPFIFWTENQYNNGDSDHHVFNTAHGDEAAIFCVDRS